MQTHVKRYNIVIKGRVHDIGFRNLISSMANFLGLRGYVFNDMDGSVKLVLEGSSNSVESFIDDIKVKTKDMGAEIESLEKNEILRNFALPYSFVKIPTSELEELGKKFDVGIELLRDLIIGQNELKNELKTGQNNSVKIQEKMLKTLEKIAKK